MSTRMNWNVRTNSLDIVLFLLLLIAVGWVVYGLASPIFSFQAVRQAHTAMISFSLWREGIALGNCRLFFGGPHGTVIPFELPVYDSIVALAYHLLGQHDAVAKGVAVVLAVCAAGMFIKLGKALLPDSKLVFWLSAFLIPPTWIHNTQTVQPEAIMMLIAVGMMLCTVKFYRSGRLRYAVLLCALSALGVCIKANEVFHIFLLPWALFLFGDRRSNFLAVAVIQLVGSAIAVYAWIQVGIQWPDTNLRNTVWSLYFNFSRLLDFQSIGKAGITIILFLAPPIVLFLTWLGIRSLKRGEGTAEWKALRLCAFVYLVAGFPLYSLHTYYLNPLVPFVALFMTKGLIILRETRAFDSRGQWTVYGLIALSLPIWIGGTQLLFEQQTEQIVPAGVLAEKYCQLGDPLIVLDQSARWTRSPVETRALYASKRFGWNVTSNNIVSAKETLEGYRIQGAKVVLVLDYAPEYEPSIMKVFRSYRPTYNIYDPRDLGLVLVEKSNKYRISIWRFQETR